MRAMSEAEWKAFMLAKPRTGKCGTTRASGSPHVTPIWYDLDDDGTIRFNEVLVRITPVKVTAHAGLAD